MPAALHGVVCSVSEIKTTVVGAALPDWAGQALLGQTAGTLWDNGVPTPCVSGLGKLAVSRPCHWLMELTC